MSFLFLKEHLAFALDSTALKCFVFKWANPIPAPMTPNTVVWVGSLRFPLISFANKIKFNQPRRTELDFKPMGAKTVDMRCDAKRMSSFEADFKLGYMRPKKARARVMLCQ